MPLLAIVWALVLAAGSASAQVGEPPRVILFVVDGAGVAHWSAGYLAADSMGRPLAVASLPVVGLLDSRNVYRLMPESASSATALATGVRAYYDAVGVGLDSLPRETVLEAAEAAGRSTGVITTTTLVDATPAAFLAHVPSRRGSVNQSSIADFSSWSGTRAPTSIWPSAIGRVSSKAGALVKLRMAKLSSHFMGQGRRCPPASYSTRSLRENMEGGASPSPEILPLRQEVQGQDDRRGLSC